MKKYYIIKYADGRDCREINSYESRNEASDALMKYLYSHNEYLNIDDDDYLSPFDFILEKFEYTEVNERITDFESARKALGLKPNDYTLSGHIAKFGEVCELVEDNNPKHIDALIALNKLFTIAEAWNKEDGFVPDFSDWNQDKWFPWFKYYKKTARFVYSYANYAPAYAPEGIGARLCFKTHIRAEQFGKQFEDLYNKIFL